MMKRKIEICKKCEQFIEWKTYCPGTMSCGCIYSETVCPFKMTKNEFLGRDVPDDCMMKTEYCMIEWNNEKKIGDISWRSATDE